MIRRRRRPTPPIEAVGPAGPAVEINIGAVLDASVAVNSALSVEEALRVVLSRAKNLLRAQEGSVMLLGEDGFLRIVVSEGIPDVADDIKIGPGEGVAGRVVESGSPLLITGRAREGEFRSFVYKDRPLTSAVSVPLKASGRTVGVLNLNTTSEELTLTESDLRLAQVFAEQAAMAIHKAQLLEEAQRRGEEIALLFEASRGLVGVLEMEPLLTRVLDGAARLVPSAGGFVCILDEEAGSLSIGVYRGIPRHEIRDIVGRPGFADLIRGEGPVSVRMSEHDAFSGLSSEGDRAVVLPIRAQGRTRAILVLVGLTQPPEETGLRLLQNFAAQAALSIGNALLYRQVDEKESELASIVASMANPVIVVDPAGRVVAANPAAEDLFNFSSDFTKDQHVSGVLGEPALEKLLTGEADGPIEVAAGRPVPRLWKARASVISSPGIGLSGRILVMDDVTSEREIEILKNNFVAVVGHELRTPLTAVKGFLKTLIRRGDKLDESQRQEALLTADAQVVRLERLIENLLYVSRISDADTLRAENTDIVDVVGKMIEEFRGRERARQFSVRGPGTLWITADRDKLDQILFHLLDNACKYSEPEAPVSVTIEDSAESVRVSIADKGVGILSGELPRIFDQFHQVDLSSTREHGGTGVGLYISKRFVEAHHGHIEVESAWGKGSTFSFTIPKYAQQPEPVGS
ncbi:MAG: GAF domain-containing protein [Actinomycetota bacterium]